MSRPLVVLPRSLRACRETLYAVVLLRGATTCWSIVPPWPSDGSGNSRNTARETTRCVRVRGLGGGLRANIILFSMYFSLVTCFSKFIKYYKHVFKNLKNNYKHTNIKIIISLVIRNKIAGQTQRRRAR